jgi:mono/diheme cytochrome c family protein
MIRPKRFAAVVLILALAVAEAADDGTTAMQRGKLLYLQHCVICHQGNGQGTPGTFPPLAKADYLMANEENGIRAIVAGLSGQITVNGTNYNNTMPPILLTDEQVAAVLTFARNTWGNTSAPITPDRVKSLRAKTRFPTFDALKAAATYAPLPAPPPDFTLREMVRLTESAVRLAVRPGARELYLLNESGNLWRVDPRSPRLEQILRAAEYLEPRRGHPGTLGFTFDRRGRMLITCNRRLDTQPFVTNEVTIYRSASENDPFALQPWVRLIYPWGIGPFNHGVSHIAEGPDGFLYVASGSRTDGNEPGRDARYFGGGEVAETACLWRIDPEKGGPPQIIAPGLRNPFGYCWDDAGRLVATDNGPDADMPEELNVIEGNNHYGFPFQFGASANKPYAYTPDAPPAWRFTPPVRNQGPSGGIAGIPLSTFDPHSSPAGIIYVGNDFPASVRGTFLVTRFGNLLKRDRDAGFDILRMRLTRAADGYEAETTTWLAGLGRPIDIVALNRAIYVLEYSRVVDNKGDVPMLPGRVLELRPR